MGEPLGSMGNLTAHLLHMLLPRRDPSCVPIRSPKAVLEPTTGTTTFTYDVMRYDPSTEQLTGEFPCFADF
jgi:hypothetical protein